jgi:hypothetical protein
MSDTPSRLQSKATWTVVLTAVSVSEALNFYQESVLNVVDQALAKDATTAAL